VVVLELRPKAPGWAGVRSCSAISTAAARASGLLDQLQGPHSGV